VELFHGTKIKRLQSDWGTEYVNKAFSDHLTNSGIDHLKSAPRSPQQNGRSERFNRTLKNGVRCLLIESGLPARFWAEAMVAVCNLRNMCPSAAIGFMIPEEIWTGQPIKKSHLEMLRVFGCQAWAKIEDGSVNVLQPQAERCINLGLEVGVKGYRLWSIKRNKVIVRRNVVFQEDVFPWKDRFEEREQKREPKIQTEEPNFGRRIERDYTFLGLDKEDTENSNADETADEINVAEETVDNAADETADRGEGGGQGDTDGYEPPATAPGGGEAGDAERPGGDDGQQVANQDRQEEIWVIS